MIFAPTPRRTDVGEFAPTPRRTDVGQYGRCLSQADVQTASIWPTSNLLAAALIANVNGTFRLAENQRRPNVSVLSECNENDTTLDSQNLPSFPETVKLSKFHFFVCNIVILI